MLALILELDTGRAADDPLLAAAVAAAPEFSTGDVPSLDAYGRQREQFKAAIARLSEVIGHLDA